MIGDCQCLVGNQYYDNSKPAEAILAQMRADFILQSKPPYDHFLEHDTAREAIIQPLIESMKRQNIDFSVIDGFPIPEQYVKVITLDFKPWEIVLASDGYPFLCPTLAESEEKLKWQRENDPLNIGQFKATKAFMKGSESFDDRAYIRFRA
jgi:glycerophosphoryl diester phosphodiesterase